MLNRNHLKITACISMLIDHIGYFFFPKMLILRYIGRLAMPLFAFFIGEGCYYTSNRKKYFLSVFSLGMICQMFYLAEDLITNKRLTFGSDSLFLNILLTFSVAIAGCYILLDAKKAVIENPDKKALRISSAVVFTAAAAAVSAVLWYFDKTSGLGLQFDYGFFGIVLPMSAVLFTDKKKRLLSFAVCLFIYCMCTYKDTSYVWFSLLTIPLLMIYNGKSGSKKLKYFFYIFYPAHLAAIYLVDMLLR